jgi:hypothetical protein
MWGFAHLSGIWHMESMSPAQRRAQTIRSILLIK